MSSENLEGFFKKAEEIFNTILNSTNWFLNEEIQNE